ncbi:MAG: RNA methyltransferase [Bacteroidetes bacterium]|nr:RNA methyltransferase [Bacteroidota bacterium]
MSQLPTRLLESLATVTGFDERSFVQVHESGQQVTSVRINPAKTQDIAALFPSAKKIPWSSYGYYLPERPSFTFDPLFHAGLYYVQEASGMFVEQALKQSLDLSKPLRVLDLCAAPGGKSTLLQSIISADSLLVSNEVIKSRVHLLEENMVKWGAANTVVVNNDPKDFARLENYFDIIVIDAPCSGSGLFRRDPSAIREWSEGSVQLCQQRQQRILADVWPALKQGGLLVYSTCSYSKEEDEDILDWINETFTAESLRLDITAFPGIVESASEASNAWGYRFFPDKIMGEGFFLGVLRKQDGDDWQGIRLKKSGLEKATRAEEQLIKPWLRSVEDLILFRQKEDVIAMPAAMQADIPVLQSALYLKQAGVLLGQPTAKELIPAHPLAMSGLTGLELVSVPLNKEEAIRYLRRDELRPDTNYRGWALVDYAGHHLGWVKVLANRVNNYYPREWRILKSPQL